MLSQMDQGQTLGSYELVARIGEGGMGEVWEGTHRHLARAAAIKLIRPQSLSRGDDYSDEVLERFRREAQATSSLRSRCESNAGQRHLMERASAPFGAAALLRPRPHCSPRLLAQGHLGQRRFPPESGKGAAFSWVRTAPPL